MAQWLKALASPPEDMDSSLKTHRTVNNCLNSQIMGLNAPLASEGNTDKCAGKT